MKICRTALLYVTQRTERTYVLILFRRFLFRTVVRWTNEMASKKLIGSFVIECRIGRNDRIVSRAAWWYRAKISRRKAEKSWSGTVSFINHSIARSFRRELFCVPRESSLTSIGFILRRFIPYAPHRASFLCYRISKHLQYDRPCAVYFRFRSHRMLCQINHCRYCRLWHARNIS